LITISVPTPSFAGYRLLDADARLYSADEVERLRSANGCYESPSERLKTLNADGRSSRRIYCCREEGCTYSLCVVHEPAEGEEDEEEGEREEEAESMADGSFLLYSRGTHNHEEVVPLRTHDYVVVGEVGSREELERRRRQLTLRRRDHPRPTGRVYFRCRKCLFRLHAVPSKKGGGYQLFANNVQWMGEHEARCVPGHRRKTKLYCRLSTSVDSRAEVDALRVEQAVRPIGGRGSGEWYRCRVLDACPYRMRVQRRRAEAGGALRGGLKEASRERERFDVYTCGEHSHPPVASVASSSWPRYTLVGELGTQEEVDAFKREHLFAHRQSNGGQLLYRCGRISEGCEHESKLAPKGDDGTVWELYERGEHNHQ
jgi:hypothetical protein